MQYISSSQGVPLTRHYLQSRETLEICYELRFLSNNGVSQLNHNCDRYFSSLRSGCDAIKAMEQEFHAKDVELDPSCFSSMKWFDEHMTHHQQQQQQSVSSDILFAACKTCPSTFQIMSGTFVRECGGPQQVSDLISVFHVPLLTSDTSTTQGVASSSPAPHNSVTHYGKQTSWTTMHHVADFPDVILGFDEDVLWKVVSSLFGVIAFAHSQGYHYMGALSANDVIVLVRKNRSPSSTVQVECIVPPPFSLFTSSAVANNAPIDPSSVESSIDVFAAGKILSTLVSVISSAENVESRPPTTFSPELLFLIKKLMSGGGAGDGSHRPSAFQVMQFQAVKLRNRIWMMQDVVREGRRAWLANRRQQTAQIEILKAKLLSSQENATTAKQQQPRDVERERLLAEREAKLNTFLELYSLTTQALDQLPINERNASALKALLCSPHSVVSSDETSGGIKAPTASPPHSVIPPSSLFSATPELRLSEEPARVQEVRSSTPTSAAMVNVVNAYTPPRSMNGTLQQQESPSPLLQEVDISDDEKIVVVTNRNHPAVGINESVEIEVIEMDDDTTSISHRDESLQNGDGSVMEGGHRRDRLREARRQYQTERSVQNNTSAWMVSHVAQLERMQQELYRSKQTPPRGEQQPTRRSPSASHHSHVSNVSSGFAPVLNLNEDETDPVQLLRKLREAVVL